MSFRQIPFGTIDAFNVVVETPPGSQIKYEYDEHLDNMKLDWIFKEGFSFPHNYGYIPETRGGDGDHLDVFVLTNQAISMGTVVACRAIGMIELLDRGEEDNKILAVPLVDPVWGAYKELADLPFAYQDFFKVFFAGLAAQKKKTIEIVGYGDLARVQTELKTANERFLEEQGKK